MAEGTRLTHVDEAGSARMVDVSAKPEVLRTATAAGRISLAAHTVELIRENAVSKCEVLTGAKRTGELFPLPI